MLLKAFQVFQKNPFYQSNSLFCMKSATSVPYGRISLFFVLVMAVLTWGFYKTYIVFFPSFEGFAFVHHFHGAMMLIWMGFLIVQPLLILWKKQSIHRLIGKSSFIVAPLVVLSIFLVAKFSYYRPEPPLPPEIRIAEIALPIPNMLAFALFYVLAILNRRHTYHHMRYMIGTGILMIGPGLGRALGVYFHIPFLQSVDIVMYVMAGIAALLMLNDYWRERSYKANAIVFLGIAACYLIWEMRMTGIWQSIGSFIAKYMF